MHKVQAASEGTTKFADMQIFEVKSENGKVKG
jgi:hypothetical protein